MTERVPGCESRHCVCPAQPLPKTLDDAIQDLLDESDMERGSPMCENLMRERLKAFVAGLVAEATEKGRELEREDWENSR